MNTQQTLGYVGAVPDQFLKFMNRSSALDGLLEHARDNGLYVSVTVFDQDTTAQIKRAEERQAITTLLGPA